MVDSDKEKIDNLIIDMDQKAYSGVIFENSPEGLQDAMLEFEVLSFHIQNCRLKWNVTCRKILLNIFSSAWIILLDNL